MVVSVGGRVLADRHVRGRSFDLRIELPRREVTVRVRAVGAGTRSIEHVLGLPGAARPRETHPRASRALAMRLRALIRAFPAAGGAYVADLATGETAGVKPRLQFPAASTLKLAIAVETLRELHGKPPPKSRLDALLRAMLLESDNDAANSLEVQLGGSTSGGGHRIDELLGRLGLHDTLMYGGYARSLSSAYVPVHGKHTTPYDLGRLWVDVQLAAEGKGPLARRFRGEFTPPDARYLLYLLAHVPDRRKLGRFLPSQTQLAHKAGWIRQARHDAGLVYWRGGALVVVVMTYAPGGVGDASDVLAGRAARVALDVLATPRRRR